MDEAEWESMQRTTIVLVGKTGNGKSSTGNSILGCKKFQSGKSFRSVTTTCQMESAVREGAEGAEERYISVVDTPGLFDPHFSKETLQEEISKCIKLTPEGIHALVVVLSARSRFTVEELAAVDTIQAIFGEKVADYLIILFTGGDDLEAEGTSLNEYLTDGKEDFYGISAFLERCRSRVVLFDNKTSDPVKQERQVKCLLDLVDKVVAENGGKPYSSELFIEMQSLAHAKEREELMEKTNLTRPNTMSEEEFKMHIDKLRQELDRDYTVKWKMFQEMIEEKIKLASDKQQQILEEKLAAAENARKQEQALAQRAKQAAEADIKKLQAELLEAREQRKAMEERIEEQLHHRKCLIL